MTTLPTELVKRLRGRSPNNYRTRSRSHRLDDKAAAALIETQAAEISSLRAKLAEAMEWIGYWLDGDEIIESCLARCQTGNPEYAPFPLVGDEAVSWLAAQADAYQNALEMMGVPSASGPKIRAARRLIEGNGNG